MAIPESIQKLKVIRGKFYHQKFETIRDDEDFEDEREPKDFTRDIPHRFLRGRSSVEQGGFFDASLITSAAQLQIIKFEKRFNYLGLRFDVFKTMVNNFITKKSSSPTSKTRMSASFFGPGGFGATLNNDEFITLISEDQEDGQPAPSFVFRSVGSTAPEAVNQASGIVSSSGTNGGSIDLLIQNSSTFCTAATFSFSPGGPLHSLNQQGFTSSFTHRFFNTGSNKNAIALSGSESSSIKGIGTTQFVNGVNSAAGRYSQFLVKAKIYGDGEHKVGESRAGAFFDPNDILFVPTKEIIVYESNIIIRSGSFKYNSSSKSAASSSGTSVTLFYQSGSNGPSGSHTGSGYLTGSHIYLSASLNHPAPSGFYAVPNTNNVLHAFKGSTTQDVGGSSVSNGIEHQIPRFVSRSVGPF